MEKVLISWIGGNDLKAYKARDEDGAVALGPLLATLRDRKFSKIRLLYNYPRKDVKSYLEWFDSKTDANIEATYVKLRSPIHFGDIYKAADDLLNKVWEETKSKTIHILLSPGTPAMQAVWILLGKTKYPSSFIQSSIEQGVQDVELPFDIAAEFLPQLAERSDGQLAELMAGNAPSTAAFDNIITQNPEMNRLKALAALFASRNVPVLIYGETGTGKELFARAIHNTSGRSEQRFIPVNCGAIPEQLIDSVLFGHAKGAFTGAIKAHIGLFEEADGGTLFLDEFGELPMEAQVRLLRVLDDGSFQRVGETATRKVDVRIIAATNRNLANAVRKNKFREDLYYRVAIGVLNLPPLRDREGDLGILSQTLMDQINSNAAGQPGYISKKISAGAKKVIINHGWPGNVRELNAVLLRASLFVPGAVIGEINLQDALLQQSTQNGGLLGRKFDKDFKIQSVMDDLVRHYIVRAMTETGQNKSKAAELLGLKNYQTLTNWVEKHGVPL